MRKYGRYLLTVVLGLVVVVAGISIVVRFFGGRQAYHRVKPVAKFARLDVDVRDFDVKIVGGDSYSIREDTTRDTRLQTERFGDTLRVTSKKDVRWPVGLATPSHTLTITVPNHLRLRRLRVSSADGMLSLETPLSVRFADINLADGDWQATHLRVKALNAKLQDGNINIADSQVQRARINQQDGDYVMQRSTLTESHLTNADGDVAMETVRFMRTNAVVTQDGDQQYTDCNIDGLLAATNDGEIRWLGAKKASPYRRAPTAARQLKATNQDGDVIIK